MVNRLEIWCGFFYCAQDNLSALFKREVKVPRAVGREAMDVILFSSASASDELAPVTLPIFVLDADMVVRFLLWNLGAKIRLLY